MKKSLIKVLEEYETKRKRKTMNALDKVLESYEVKTKVESTTDGFKDSDYELWEYLCGSGNVQHLYNHYDLVDNGVNEHISSLYN